MLFPIFERGAFFGEQCLLDETSEVTYMAALRTELLCVPKETLENASREHLDILAQEGQMGATSGRRHGEGKVDFGLGQDLG